MRQLYKRTKAHLNMLYVHIFIMIIFFKNIIHTPFCTVLSNKKRRKRKEKKQVLYKRAHVLVHICIFNIESDSIHALERNEFKSGLPLDEKS